MHWEDSSVERLYHDGNDVYLKDEFDIDRVAVRGFQDETYLFEGRLKRPLETTLVELRGKGFERFIWEGAMGMTDRADPDTPSWWDWAGDGSVRLFLKTRRPEDHDRREIHLWIGAAGQHVFGEVLQF
ncbi:hypothetical protein [Consotaella aegiceratis]|uniref:hypothetical protein n=1 Tax=Consotaella aegiceratis TaxID=3097961 RepID=UPI002F404ADD